ncbi:unnamed protein product [Gongylonema pulchrum]|uniref:Gelsolin-like domain-containing protein n=1 Tax=Gongylonema pulchrum TaxID=637853 RepID=A0A183E3V7_9BILA|nr:unnamed protein product [Gongylonema pulchrum]
MPSSGQPLRIVPAQDAASDAGQQLMHSLREIQMQNASGYLNEHDVGRGEQVVFFWLGNVNRRHSLSSARRYCNVTLPDC